MERPRQSYLLPKTAASALQNVHTGKTSDAAKISADPIFNFSLFARIIPAKPSKASLQSKIKETDILLPTNGTDKNASKNKMFAAMDKANITRHLIG